MKLYNIAFTGPREIDERDAPVIQRGLRDMWVMGYEQPVVYHTGGAAGFDSRVFGYLGYHDSAVNVLHIPFQYQYDALQEYLDVEAADIEHYMANLCPLCGPKKDYMRPTDNWLYQKRNEHMVDSAQLLVYYNPWKKGGTQNCINYAKTTGIEMVDIRAL